MDLRLTGRSSYSIEYDHENQVLEVTWEYDTYLEEKYKTQHYNSFLVLYSAADEGVPFQMLTNDLESTLSSGKQNIKIKKNKNEVTYEMFIFFLESYGEGNTDSLHLGSIKV